MNLDECSEVITYKKIVLVDCKGGTSKFYLINERQIEVIKVRVDACLNLQGNKCDFLLRVEKPVIEIYVELKGCRVEDALEQLENSIKQISQDCKKLLKYCYIIHRRCPMNGTDIQNKKKEFKSNYNACLEIKKSGFEVNLESILHNRDR